jgi:hypothetical protein
MLYSLLNLVGVKCHFESLFNNDEEEIVISDQFLSIVSDFNQRNINQRNINEIIALCDYIMMDNVLQFLMENCPIDHYVLNEYNSQNYKLPKFMRGNMDLATIGKYGIIQYIDYVIDYSSIYEDMAILYRNLCRYGHLDCMKYMIKHGYHINMESLAIASRYGHLHILIYGFEQGLCFTSTELEIACQHGQLICFKYMIGNDNEYSIKVNKDLLYFSGINGHLDCMKYIYMKIILAMNMIGIQITLV